MSSVVELAEASFDPAARLAAFSAALDGEGAIVSFTGHARGRAKDGAPVDALVLEAYRGVTLASMKAIAADAHARFAITRSLVVHRAGRIAPGEAIVFVATASSHRRAAFDAADYLMDRLKTEAIFWKREEGAEGGRWIEPTDADRADAARWQHKQD
jgi:molybdopterin synthase catalytic subunit